MRLFRSLAIPFGCLCCVFVWYSRLDSVLFVDESGTFFIIKDGLSEAFFRTLAIQGQSPLYYSLLAIWCRIFGTGEWSLRVPSTLLSLGTLFILRNIFRQRYNGKLVDMSLLLLATDPVFVFSATTARPYALALFLHALGLFYFCKWLQGPSTAVKALLASFTFSLLGTYAVYQTAFIWPVLTILTLRQNKSYWILFIPVTLALIPGGFQALSIASRSEQLAFQSGYPGWTTLLAHIISPRTALIIILMLVIKCTIHRTTPTISRDDGLKSLHLPLLLFLVPRFCTLLLAANFGNSMLVARYNALSVLGETFLIFEILRRLKDRLSQNIIWTILLLGWIVPLMKSTPPNISWRKIVRYMQDKDSTNRCRTVARVGLVESDSVALLRDETMRGFIASPLNYYGRDKVSLLPLFSIREEDVEYISNLGSMAHSPCIFLVSWNDSQKQNSSLFFLNKVRKENHFSIKNKVTSGLVTLYHLAPEQE